MTRDAQSRLLHYKSVKSSESLVFSRPGQIRGCSTNTVIVSPRGIFLNNAKEPGSYSLKKKSGIWETLNIWNFLTTDHPTHGRTTYSQRNTLLTAEYPTHRGTPYSQRNILLTAEHFTQPGKILITKQHPSHQGTPYSLQNTLLTA